MREFVGRALLPVRYPGHVSILGRAGVPVLRLVAANGRAKLFVPPWCSPVLLSEENTTEEKRTRRKVPASAEVSITAGHSRRAFSPYGPDVAGESKYSPNPWSIRLLSPLFPASLGWLALVLHGFGEYLPR